MAAALPLAGACGAGKESLSVPPPASGAGGTLATSPFTASGGTAGRAPAGRDGGGGDEPDAVGRILRPIGSSCSTEPVAPLVPLQPQMNAADSCAAATNASATWSYPSPTLDDSVDDRGRLTGRWVSCTSTTVVGPAGSGIEFGGNGRWRLLAQDPTGSLVPATEAPATGSYVVLGTGQTNLRQEDPTSYGQSFFVVFAPGMDAVQFRDNAGNPLAIYARAQPSPLDGADNPPSVSDGRCSMVGTWDLPANLPTPQEPSAWITFDDAGNFTGAPVDGTCGGFTFYGTYELTPQLFQLTTNVGMGQCAWWFSAAYPATFDDSCTHVTLVQHIDNCTGGRGWLNRTTTLTRRQ